MPWTAPSEPSLGLAVLKAALRDHGIGCRVMHAAPLLLRHLTIETYQFIASCWGVNDFVFMAPLEPVCDDGQLSCLVERAQEFVAAEGHPKYTTVESICNLVLTIRDEIIPPFLADCADRILRHTPKMVGFTCMFDQTIASVALAKLLKERDPGVSIVLGGYALEGAAATNVANAFPWIDTVVLGDGEAIIVELARAALRQPAHSSASVRVTHSSSATPGGVITLMPIEAASTAPPEITAIASRVIRAPNIDLVNSPLPDYHDWFQDVRELETADAITINTRVLPIESSRGCWWGQYKHCIFCGIDEEALKYRHRSAADVLQMLTTLRHTYGDHVFRFADYILPKAFYAELLPALAEQHPKFSLEAEVKANQPPERVKLFADAGFRAFQPGIESFSTDVLASMDKGVRAIDNVSLLKAAYVNRLIVNYNFLYGLPDDTLDDYLRMAEMIPRLYHLTPPIARTETIVTRFSPLQVDPTRFGIEAVPRHHRCYDVLMSDTLRSQTGFSLDDYCYYFDRGFEYGAELQALYLDIVLQIDHWKSQHRSQFVELSVRPASTGLEFHDSRFGREEQFVLDGLASDTYLACNDRPTEEQRIVDSVVRKCGASPSDVLSCLTELDERRIIWRDGRLVLGLAVPAEITAHHRDTGWPHTWMSLYVS